MVFGKNNKGAWRDMTPCIEVKMLIKTDEGDMNVNFYTTVEFPYSLNPNDFDDYFCESVSDSVDEVLARMKQGINAGWAIASYRCDELFTFSFFKGKEEDRWKYQTTLNLDDPTIH